jgi:hypothetical protein
MGRRGSVVGHALAGWLVSGATIGVGRLLVSPRATLVVHAAVAPLAFGLLARHHVRSYPASAPMATSLAKRAVVAGLDAFFVAPILERSYAMFGGVLGICLPLRLIFTSTRLVGRMTEHRASGRGAPRAPDRRTRLTRPPGSQLGRS